MATMTTRKTQTVLGILIASPHRSEVASESTIVELEGLWQTVWSAIRARTRRSRDGGTPQRSVQLRLELLEDGGRLMAVVSFGGADDEFLERVDPGAHVAEPRVQEARLVP